MFHVDVGRYVNIIVEIEGIKLANFKEIPAARLRKEKAYGERSQERKKARKGEETGTIVGRFAQGWTVVFKMAHIFNVKEFCLPVLSFSKDFYHV